MLVFGHVGVAGREGWSFHLKKQVEIGPLPLGGAMLVIALVNFKDNYNTLPNFKRIRASFLKTGVPFSLTDSVTDSHALMRHDFYSAPR
jgi:hypothetical protein